jgi:hypothetical protein
LDELDGADEIMAYFNHQAYKKHIDAFDAQLVDILLAELRPMIDAPDGNASESEFRTNLFKDRIIPLYDALRTGRREALGRGERAWSQSGDDTNWKMLKHWIALLGRDYMPAMAAPKKEPSASLEPDLDPLKEEP